MKKRGQLYRMKKRAKNLTYSQNESLECAQRQGSEKNREMGELS